MIYLQLFWEFLKVGCFSFGGAYCAIPLIRDAVLSHGWMSEEVFTYLLAVCESTPGPIMVNTATYVGNMQGGVLGAALATLGVILPAFLIMLLLAKVMRRFLENRAIRATVDGILPCVVGVIGATGLCMIVQHCFGSFGSLAFSWRSAAIGLILAGICVVWKKLKKKEFSAILLIAVSAVLGIVLYAF